MPDYSDLNPAILKPGLTTPDGANLKPSLVTAAYSGGTPSAANQIKPHLRNADGSLKAGLLTPDGLRLKPSLLKGGGLLDFLPPALRAGGLALGTSRLFGSYSGPLGILQRAADSVQASAGLGSRFTSAEAIALCGKNLLSYTSSFTNAYWGKSRCDPSTESGLGKFTCTEAAGGGMSVVTSIVPTPAAVLSYSFTAKKGTSDFVACTIYDNGANGVRQWFNLTTSTVATSDTFGSGWVKSNATIDEIGGGLYGCTFAATAPASATTRIAYYPSPPSDGGFASTVGDIGYLADPQLEFGSTATSHEPRSTAGASICLLAKLYGQIGAFFAEQTDSTKMPQVVPRQIGELPKIVGDGVDDHLVATGFMRSLDATDLTIVSAGQNALVGNGAAVLLGAGGAASTYSASGNLAHGNSGLRRVVSLRSEGAAQSARVNGVEAATASVSQVATWGGNDFYLGRAELVYANPGLTMLALPAALPLEMLSLIESTLMSEYQVS